MTNGLYLSNMHRVFNSKAGVSRYSVPTFFDLDYEYKIKTLQNLGDQFKAEPKEMTVGEYLAYMYQKLTHRKKPFNLFNSWYQNYEKMFPLGCAGLGIQNSSKNDQ